MISTRYLNTFKTWYTVWQSYGQWPVYRWCICQKWWFSIPVLNYQKIYFLRDSAVSIFQPNPYTHMSSLWQLEWLYVVITVIQLDIQWFIGLVEAMRIPIWRPRRWAAVVSMVSFSVNHSKVTSLDGIWWYLFFLVLVDIYGLSRNYKLSSAYQRCLFSWDFRICVWTFIEI